MARPKRFELLTPRFVVVEAAHTRSRLIARVSAGMAGHETGDSASDRPIFTLLHAGVGGCIEKPLERVHTGHPVQMPTHAARPDSTMAEIIKHLYEPWLTTTTTSGAGSSSLRTGVGTANSEKRKRMS